MSTDTSAGASSQPVLSTAADFGIQISPAVTPEFVRSVHDYVIDCTTTPQAQLTVADPATIGFSFLGTTSSPQAQLPASRFEQTMTLSPGQRFHFGIAGAGTYSVRCLPPDFPPLAVSVNGVPQAQWYLFTPTVLGAGPYFIVMTDAHGTPVWWSRQANIAPTEAFDAKVLGPDAIAWAPPDPSAANGTYVIKSFSGRLLNTLTGNLDSHDLQPTPTGTYLVIHNVARVCPPDCADMSPWGGSAQMSVTDAEILEIDGNSNVLWKWRTRDHIDLSETGNAGWFATAGFDIIHMNAVEPDGRDGVMFSARHLNAIYHLTKSTGAIDWKIGGTNRPESLVLSGDVRPTATGLNVFSGQHDVRRWPDGTISVHDNGTLLPRPPAVIRFTVDPSNRTATVVEEVQDSRVSGSICCGSARLLPGGHWLVQWGAAPYMTELDSAGDPVLTIQYNAGTTFSYRAVPVVAGTVAAETLRNGMDTTLGN